MPNPITPGHAARVLAKASAVDRRDPDAAADEVWAETLTRAGVDYRDAMAAVAIHYGRTVDYLRPFHVIAIARELAHDRVGNEGVRAAIEAYDSPDVVNPRTVAPRILQMLADARARVAAEASQAAQDGPGRPGGGYGHPVSPRAVRGDLSAPRGWLVEHVDHHAAGTPVDECTFCRQAPPIRTSREILNGPVRQACQNDRDNAGGDWCPGWITFAPGDPQAACDTCGAWSGVYANTDPACPRQDGWVLP